MFHKHTLSHQCCDQRVYPGHGHPVSSVHTDTQLHLLPSPSSSISEEPGMGGGGRKEGASSSEGDDRASSPPPARAIPAHPEAAAPPPPLPSSATRHSLTSPAAGVLRGPSGARQLGLPPSSGVGGGAARQRWGCLLRLLTTSRRRRRRRGGGGAAVELLPSFPLRAEGMLRETVVFVPSVSQQLSRPPPHKTIPNGISACAATSTRSAPTAENSGGLEAQRERARACPCSFFPPQCACAAARCQLRKKRSPPEAVARANTQVVGGVRTTSLRRARVPCQLSPPYLWAARHARALLVMWAAPRASSSS